MYTQVFDTLCHVALDLAGTTKMIEEAAGEWRAFVHAAKNGEFDH